MFADFRRDVGCALLTAALCVTSCAPSQPLSIASGTEPPDPEPTEDITPLKRSAKVTFTIDPPCETCEQDCPITDRCPPIAFETIVAAIPELSSGDRKIRHESECGVEWFHLEPVVLAPHLVASRAVRCSCSPDRLECWLESFREVYEDDPHTSIPVSDTVTVSEALEIAALFRAKKVANAPESLFTPATLSGIYRNGRNFELYLANCGENALVRLERSWGGRRLRYVKSLHGSGCI